MAEAESSPPVPENAATETAAPNAPAASEEVAAQETKPAPFIISPVNVRGQLETWCRRKNATLSIHIVATSGNSFAGHVLVTLADGTQIRSYEYEALGHKGIEVPAFVELLTLLVERYGMPPAPVRPGPPKPKRTNSERRANRKRKLQQAELLAAAAAARKHAALIARIRTQLENLTPSVARTLLHELTQGKLITSWELEVKPAVGRTPAFVTAEATHLDGSRITLTPFHARTKDEGLAEGRMRLARAVGPGVLKHLERTAPPNPPGPENDQPALDRGTSAAT